MTRHTAAWFSAGAGLFLAACVGDDPAPAASSAPDGGGGADAREASNDGGEEKSDAGGPSDASTHPGPRCDPSKPFGVPSNVPNVNSSAYDSYVTLTSDERVLYLSSDREGGNRIWVTTREDPSGTFAPPKIDLDLSTGDGDDRGPSVTGDGNTIFFRSNRPGTLGFNDIWVSSRSGTGAKFGKPSGAQKVNTAADDVDPAVRSDGSAIVYATNSGAPYTLHEATITAGVISPPAPVAGLGVSGDVRFPVLSADGKELYFATGAAHASAKGGFDVWVARRSGSTGAFMPAEPAVDLSSSADDQPGWISPDGCVMYFMSSRPGGFGANDIWIAKRPK